MQFSITWLIISWRQKDIWKSNEKCAIRQVQDIFHVQNRVCHNKAGAYSTRDKRFPRIHYMCVVIHIENYWYLSGALPRLSRSGNKYILVFIDILSIPSWCIDENCRVITLIFEKYDNLPPCLGNYALFSLPPIFATILYTYPLRYIIYLRERSGNIISN